MFSPSLCFVFCNILYYGLRFPLFSLFFFFVVFTHTQEIIVCRFTDSDEKRSPPKPNQTKKSVVSLKQPQNLT